MYAVIRLLDRKDLEGLFQLLRTEIAAIAHEVDFILMVCNSVHAVLPDLRHTFNVPILSIYEEVCKEIALSGVRKAGILGTRTTTSNNFYQQELAAYGIQYQLLPAETGSIVGSLHL